MFVHTYFSIGDVKNENKDECDLIDQPSIVDNDSTSLNENGERMLFSKWKILFSYLNLTFCPI